MKKQIYLWAMAYCCFAIAFLTSCSDKEDFPNKPQAIDVNSLDITPVNGGFKVAWIPNPADENFVFLHIELTDHDQQTRSYNISRYGSNLVTPELTDKDGNKYPNPNEAVSVEIKDLVNQSYTLHFSAFNNDNQRIDLGSREVTPADYTQCPPDSIFAVNIQCKGGKVVSLEWREVPKQSSSTTEKIRFKFTNVATQEVVTKEFAPGTLHSEFAMDEAGAYSVEFGTVSVIGKEWTKKAKDIEVIKFYSIEYWNGAQKKNWTVTGSSVQESEGPFQKLIDGNAGTFWSSSWNDKKEFYTLDITLDKVDEIVGVILQQRQNCAKPSWHRCVKDFSIYLKENETDEFPTEPNFRGQLKVNDDPNATDHLDRQDFNFDLATKAKYIRLSLDSPMFPGTSNDGAFCMAEFGIFVKDTSKGDE